VVDEVVLSPIEEQASAQGWTNKEEWIAAGKEAEDWKDARTFVRDGEMMTRIQKQGKALDRAETELTQLKEAFSTLTEHHKKVAQIERQKLEKQLKKEKAEALRADDGDTVVEIDEQLQALKEAAKEEKIEQRADAASESGSELVDDWLDNPENSWYHDNAQMHAAADRHFLKLSKQKGVSVEAALKQTEDFIRERFPHNFKGKKVVPQSKVHESDEAVNKAGSRGKKFTVKDLDDVQSKTAKEFVKMGVFKSAQEYVDELVKTGDLK
jgi:hypothetical protein